MVLQIEDLSKSFKKQKVLNRLNLTFQQKQVIALLGPNGSGKTTLLKCLLGMVIPDQGRILYNGEDISKGVFFREKVGYMPQIGQYPESMTVEQLFDMMKDLRYNKEILDTALIETFGISSFFKKALGSISGGMKQKVGAALAFLFCPDILILDEPTAGLDPLSSEQLKEKINKEKDNGKLIIITSHILSDLDEMATDLVYLDEGNLQFYKPMEKLKQETGEVQLSKVLANIQQKKHLKFSTYQAVENQKILSL